MTDNSPTSAAILRRLPFALVDAFALRPFTGNPCAVVLEADSLSSSEMLTIAKEMNQSETAFLMKSTVADLRARYFTTEREIPLAGHPTIASIHAALTTGYLNLPAGKMHAMLELRDGPIRVDLATELGPDFFRMFQRKPEFFTTHDPSVICPIFGLEKDDLIDGYPIQTVSTGTPQLMIPLRSIEKLRNISVNTEAYLDYRAKADFFSPHLFCLGGATDRGDTFARHPDGAPGTHEDAFTGSATGGMAAYLFRHGLMKKRRFIAEQGHWLGRPGEAIVEILGNAAEIEGVSVAGRAVMVVRGEIFC